MVLAVVMMAVFSIISVAVFRLSVQDTKHRVATTQFDQAYYLTEGANEWAQFYVRYQAPHTHDGITANDPAPFTIDIDGTQVTVEMSDTYQQ